MSGCTPDAGSPTPDQDSGAGLDEPVSSGDEPEPEPAPGDMTAVTIQIDSIDILLMESWPLQAAVQISGTLPDACTALTWDTPERAGDTFIVTVNGERPVEAACAQVLTPFSQSIPLDIYGLPAGTYTVQVNDRTTTFTLDQDNVLGEEPGSGEQPPVVVVPPPGGPPVGEPPVVVVPAPGLITSPPGGTAYIDNVQVETQPGQPPVLTIYGSLSDGCTQLRAISDTVQGSRIIVTVETSRDPNLMCTMALAPFQTTYTLSSVLAAGTYTLEVNDFTTQFTMP
ncbi:MAG: hypothetical protein Kow00124_18670 [Anaerolineae bacterium]